MASKDISLKENMYAKDLTYSDSFINLKSDKIISLEGVSLNSYDALSGVVDCATNNYSNVFLTNKGLNSDWLKANTKDIGNKNGTVTTLSFISNEPQAKQNKGSWLYFDKNYEFWDTSIKEVDCVLVQNRPELSYYNYIFYIEFIDETTCRISHTFGDLTFYLTVTDGFDIKFTTDDGENSTFNCILNDNTIRLFKKVNKKEIDPINDETVQQTEYYYISLEKTTANDVGNLQIVQFDPKTSEDLPESNENNILYITNNILKFEMYLDNSWISYDRSQYVDSIKRSSSTFNLDGQMLIHHEYETNDSVNFIPLKNNQTYKGSTVRGSNLTKGVENYPEVEFRTYTSIASKTNQEKGNGLLTLSYTFTDQEYIIEEGETIDFYLPTNVENYGVSSIYPYEKLNINDTKFVKNGAFGSNIPAFSDKFYTQQNYFEKDGSINNAQYLCTWLCKAGDGYDSVWMDRWYYPDIITKNEALREKSNFSKTFENQMDKRRDSELEESETSETERKLTNNGFIDVVSDAYLVGGGTYKYSRVSKDMVSDVISLISDDYVDTVKTQSNKNCKSTEKLSLDGKSWRKINYDKIKNTNRMNVNFDLYLDSQIKIGPQIFGSDPVSGINIQNRKDIAPYEYVYNEYSIYVLNNNQEVKHQFDLYETYGSKIIKACYGNLFDDIFLFVEEDSKPYLYILSFELSLESKLCIDKDSLCCVNDTTYHKSTFGDTLDVLSLLKTYNPSQHNGNLYIPYYQKILKVILCPDCDKDIECIGSKTLDDENEQFARLLNPDEFSANFITDEIDENGTVGVESGTIEVDNVVKNIAIDEDGNIYGLNYENMALSADKDTLYGLYKKSEYVKKGGWYWLFNSSLSKTRSGSYTSKYAEFASPDSIDAIQFNSLGEMCLVRNFTISQANEEDDTESYETNRRFEIYSKQKELIYQKKLTSYANVIAVDGFTYIDSDGVEQPCFVIYCTSEDGSLSTVKYLSNSKKVVESSLGITISSDFNGFLHGVNNFSLQSYSNENKLYFNLFLPSNYTYDYRGTITMDLEDIETGWYNINLSLDLDEAIFQVKINDIEYGYLDSNTTQWFKPYINSNGSMFGSSYYVGCLGKLHGSILNRILQNSEIDPYICRNSSIENFKLYKKSLSLYEYQAMRLESKQINQLSLTIPCGIRANIDEMVRYFRYSSPGAISNSVKINISGTGLTTSGEFEILKKNIIESLNSNLDCSIDVKEINFLS